MPSLVGAVQFTTNHCNRAGAVCELQGPTGERHTDRAVDDMRCASAGMQL